MAQLFAQAAQRGVVVKGLIRRSHLDVLAYSEAENRDLSETISAARQQWYDDGQVGERPPGRLRPERLPWYTRTWALPVYRLVYDPDGRPLRARLAGTW